MFIKIIIRSMKEDEYNEYADTAMLFYAKFIATVELEQGGPLLKDICEWLLQVNLDTFAVAFFVNNLFNQSVTL